MNEAKHFKEIPDDVKQEMLLLFETYSQNELINKLRSLRENKSPEKTPVLDSASSKDSQSQLHIATVGTKSNSALPCSSSPISNSFSGNSEESSSLSYDCANNPSSIPVTLQKSKLKNLKISLSATSNAVSEDISPKISETNCRNRKIKLVNKPKLKSTNSNNSSACKQPLDSIKASNVSPKTNRGIKTRQKCFEARSDPQSEAEPETIPDILHKINVKIKALRKTTCNSSENLDKRNLIIEGANLETGKSINAPLREPSVAVSNKNEIIGIKNSDPPSEKKNKNTKLLKANKTKNSYQVNASSVEPATVTTSVNVNPGRSKIISLRSSDKSPVKNKKLPLCDIDVPLIEQSATDGVNEVINKKSGNMKSSKKIKILTGKVNLVPNLEVNSAVIEAEKRTDDNVKSSVKSPVKKLSLCDIDVPLIEQSASDGVNEVIKKSVNMKSSKKVKILTGKVNLVPNLEMNSAVIELTDVNVKSSDKSPVKNLPLCDIDVPLVEQSSIHGVNEVIDKNKSMNMKSSKKVKLVTEKVNLVSNLEVNSAVIEAEKLTDVNVTDASGRKFPQNELTSKKSTEVQALLSCNNINPCLHSKVSTNDLIEACNTGDCNNTMTSTELKSDNQAITTRSSLRIKRNRILPNTETVSTSCLKPKIVKKKMAISSNIDKQPSIFAGVHQENNYLLNKVSPDYVEASNSPATSTELSSDIGVSNTNCASLRRKMSDIATPNSKTVSDCDNKDINIKEFDCNAKGKTQSLESYHLIQNTDAISTGNSKLGDENKSNEVNKSGRNTFSQIEQDAEAYSRLSRLCSLQGLNIDDIFRRKEVKGMIDKYKNNAEGIVFIGTHRSSSTGKIEPTVHVHKSKKILMETLSKIPDSSDTLKVKNN